MVCTAKDFLGWKDFPKGLRVLLLDKNSTSADEIRSKLEEMDYIVSTFYNENEALTAISTNSEGFHVAIVEVSTGNSDGRFKFLEHAKDLPTIMTSDMHCLSTMMKCIVLGAVEFLRKPLSKDKLRNIWQHVVHKALNSVGKGLPESMQPVKESMVSMLQLKLENGEPEIQISVETENVTRIYKNTAEQSAGSDKYPAPSTLQIEQGVKLLDERERLEQDGESKSVETTCGNSGTETTFQAAGSKDECNISSCLPSKDCTNKCGGDARMLNEASRLHNSRGSKANRKKMKIDWTPELHKKFVQSVEQLGVDQAIPSCILELMKVDGLTRHNVASHLQKYRMQRRHILPKGNDRRWPNPRESMQRNCYSHKPVMAFPPDSLVYPAWVPPSSYGANVQMWGPPCYPAWPYTGMYADAWGCPMMPPPPCPSIPQILQNASRFQSAADTTRNSYSMPQNLSDLHPAEEVIDKVVREAISKPWLPLPLGLKPPSAESVLTELSKQGLSTFSRRPH